MIRTIVMLPCMLLFCGGIACGQIRIGPNVPIPVVELPFTASRIAISADGKWAVAWNIAKGQTQPSSLAVIDVGNRRLLSQAIIDEPILDATIGELVYTVTKSRIGAFSREQLKLLKSVMPPKQAMQKAVGKNQKLRLVADHHLSYGPTIRFEVPTFQTIGNDIQQDMGMDEGLTSFGWMLDGVLWEKNMSRPRLLVWPYQFRQTKFNPQAGVWHTFAESVNPWNPDGQVRTRWDMRDTRALEGCLSAPIRLAVVRRDDRYDLVVAPLDSNEPISTLNLESGLNRYPMNEPKPDLAIGGLKYTVLIEKKVYLGSLDSLVRSMPKPFQLIPHQSTFVLSANSATQVHYDAEGATEFRLFSEGFEQTSGDGDFSVSIPEETIEAQITSTITSSAFREQALKVDDNQVLTHKYAEQLQKAFFQLVGLETEGIPIPIRVRITARNSEGVESSLSHDYLIDIPLDQFERMLDERYPRSKLRSVSDKQSDAESKNLTANSLEEDPQPALPPSEEDATSRYLGQLLSGSRVDIAQADITRLANVAKQNGEQRQRQQFENWLNAIRWRILTDLLGNKIEVRVLQSFAGQITLSTRDGVEFTVDESQLDETSRANLQQAVNNTIPQDNDYWRKFALVQNTRAVRAFQENQRGLPSWAISDAEGQPMLSWRVLLLPELGYPELFELFCLDEPWDSEHNTQLISFMPSVFALDPNLRSGFTSLQTILDGNSPLTSTLAYDESLLEDQGTWPIFVESHADLSVTWSKPSEMKLADLAQPEQALRARSGGYTVVTLDGNATRLSVETSTSDWNQLFGNGSDDL
ncbi:MAG: hypothetical protein R3C53_21800 [Pirellulaceae bacterium]